jgi:hypothetical protein
MLVREVISVYMKIIKSISINIQRRKVLILLMLQHVVHMVIVGYVELVHFK